MNQRFFSFYLLSTFFLLSCSLPVEIQTEHKKDIEFSKLKSYSWLDSNLSTAPTFGQTEVIKNIRDMAKRTIKPTIDSELTRKGFQEVPSGSPDFIVRYHAGTNTARPENLGAVNYRMGTHVGPYQMGMLAIDIINPETNVIIWRAEAEGVLQGDGSNNTRLKKTIIKMLSDFPPG